MGPSFSILRLLSLGGIAAATVFLGAMAPYAAEQAAAARTISRNFVSSAACAHGGSVTTTFVIPDADELTQRFGGGISAVWIDLSLFNNGYAPGTFVGAGPVVPSSAGPVTFAWAGMQPGLTHYFRFNALTPGGWRTITSGSIAPPDCARILRYDCAADTTVTVMFYIPPTPGAQQQWLDLALTHFLLRPPTPFISAGPFPAEGAAFTWQGIVSWRTHHFRVNARFPNGAWAQQHLGTFTPPNCNNLPAPVS